MSNDTQHAMTFRDEFKEWANRRGWDVSEASTIKGELSFVNQTVNALWAGWHGRACADFTAHLTPRQVTDEDVAAAWDAFHEHVDNRDASMRAALESFALTADRQRVAASGSVPDAITEAPFYWEKGGGVKQSASDGYVNGWNAYREAILTQRGEVRDELREVLKDLLRHVDKETCTHEETHRGGAIWTICDHCGKKWADDQGGFKPHSDAPAVARARDLLDAAPDAGKDGSDG